MSGGMRPDIHSFAVALQHLIDPHHALDNITFGFIPRVCSAHLAGNNEDRGRDAEALHDRKGVRKDRLVTIVESDRNRLWPKVRLREGSNKVRQGKGLIAATLEKAHLLLEQLRGNVLATHDGIATWFSNPVIHQDRCGN